VGQTHAGFLTGPLTLQIDFPWTQCRELSDYQPWLTLFNCRLQNNRIQLMKNKLNCPFLRAGLVWAVLLVAGCQSSRNSATETTTSATVSALTKESQAAATPESALAELKAGNARFVAGRPLKRNLLEDVKATASGQYPIAVVLSCLDSRKPIEIVLDQGIGDIFSARVAGNVLNDDILGSLEFACKVSGAKLIAVIGHSNCGAIKGAVDGVELGNLTGLLNKIRPAMGQVPADIQPRSSKNLEFVDKVAEANVRLVMQQIHERSSILREMLDQGQIGLAGGMYDLSTGEVHFFDK
jgi:carbonic anhydrase